MAKSTQRCSVTGVVAGGWNQDRAEVRHVLHGDGNDVTQLASLLCQHGKERLCVRYMLLRYRKLV